MITEREVLRRIWKIWQRPPGERVPANELQEAVATLRADGYSVQLLSGLWVVDGKELTELQVIDVWISDLFGAAVFGKKEDYNGKS